MLRMKKGSMVLPAFGAVLIGALFIVPARGGEDPKADAVADAVMKAGGGAQALAAVKYMRFTFTVEKEGKTATSRTHYWDRVQNRHRIEMTGDDGTPIICLTYLPTQEGVCTVAGKVVMDADAASYVKKAHAAWVKDTYWLLMPYKMKDSGVHLTYDGEVKEGGKVYDKVMLTFDDGGALAPKDRYWAFVDRGTGRMDRWAYVLQDEKGQPGTGEPQAWSWKAWSRYGGVMLSTEKVSADGKTRVLFRDLSVFDEMPDSVFSKTQPVELPKPAPKAPSKAGR